MALIRLNEQHGTALHRRDCRKCREETLHDARGCIHCGAPHAPAAVTVVPFRYGRMPSVPAPKAEPRARRIGPTALPPAPPGQRRCTKCREAKPVTEFGSSSRYPDGLQHQCKACLAAGERRRYAQRGRSRR